MSDNNVRIRYIGRMHELPREVQDKMRWAEEDTARNTGTTLTLALNYGGTLRDWWTHAGRWRLRCKRSISLRIASPKRISTGISIRRTCRIRIC